MTRVVPADKEAARVVSPASAAIPCGVPGMPNPLAVDAVFVLAVKTFRERIAHVTRELDRHGIAFEFIFDFDVPDIDDQLVAARFGCADMPRSIMSLVLKHLQAWRLACQRGHSRILVFEDDVLLSPQFAPRLNEALHAAETLPPGWLIYLGGADARVPDRFFLARELLIALPIATTEGYVTDLAACRKRVAWSEAHQIDKPSDHLLRRVDAALGIRHYWLPDSLVEQGSVTGLFDSVLDTNRMQYHRLINTARNRWNKLRRRQLRRLWVNVASRLRGGNDAGKG
jgi:glycosyl transferase, family 25